MDHFGDPVSAKAENDVRHPASFYQTLVKTACDMKKGIYIQTSRNERPQSQINLCICRVGLDS